MLKYSYKIIARETTKDIPVKTVVEGKAEYSIKKQVITKKYIVTNSGEEYEIPTDVEYAVGANSYISCIIDLIEQYNNVTKTNIDSLYNEIMELIYKIHSFDIKHKKKGVLVPLQVPYTINGESIGQYVERTLKSKLSYAEFLPIAEPNPKAWLIALKRLMPVLKVTTDSHKHAANVIQHFISNIRHQAGDTTYKAYRNEQVPYLFSNATGGTGKNMFIEAVIGYCNRTFGIESTTRLVDFGTSKFATALLAHNMEATHFKMNDVLNNIFDNAMFTTDEKYRANIDLKSRVTSIMASNRLPTDSNTRRFGIIEYESLAPYRKWSVHQQAKYGYADNMDEYVESLFKYCPREPLFTIEQKDVKNSNDELIEDVLMDKVELLEAYVGGNTKITASRLMKDLGDDKRLQYYDKLKYAAFINNRLLDNEMTRVGTPNLCARFKKSYYQKLLILSGSSNDEYGTVEKTPESLVCDSILEWDKLIGPDNDPEKGPSDFHEDKPIDELIPNTVECADKFATEMRPITNGTDSEFMMLAVNKEGHTGRKIEDLVPTGFSFESDSLTMEEQLTMLNEVVKNPLVNDACYSGNKSVHYHVLMEPTPMTADQYKYCWHELAKAIFADKYDILDKSMSNMNRLTRKPNAIRKDNGVEQSLLYYSDNRVMFDPSRYLNDYKTRLALKPTVEYQHSDIVHDLEYLKDCYNKNHKETIRLALDAIEGKTIPAGSNMIGALYALKNMNVDVEILRQVATEFNRQHPSNIGKNKIVEFVK